MFIFEPFDSKHFRWLHVFVRTTARLNKLMMDERMLVCVWIKDLGGGCLLERRCRKAFSGESFDPGVSDIILWHEDGREMCSVTSVSRSALLLFESTKPLRECNCPGLQAWVKGSEKVQYLYKQSTRERIKLRKKEPLWDLLCTSGAVTTPPPAGNKTLSAQLMSTLSSVRKSSGITFFCTVPMLQFLLRREVTYFASRWQHWLWS